MKVEVYKIKMDTRDEFPVGLMGAAARIKKYENHLRRTTHDLRTRFVEDGIFGNFLCTVTVFSVQQICHLNVKIKLI